MSIPNNGSDVRIRGIKAQCIAQATEAVTPTASQFILKNIFCIPSRKYNPRNSVAKKY